MRGQFIGIDFFENLKVLVVFTGYNSFVIWFIIFCFLQGGMDFSDGWGELFNIAIMLVGIVDDMLEHCSRDGENLVPSLYHESFDWDGGYNGKVEQVSR
jgi:hypothetical protein